MAVYVDRIMKYPKTAGWPYEEACHMIADTLDELHRMAAKIGLKRVWFQNSPPHSVPHYDLTVGKKHQALANGALDADDEAARQFYMDCVTWWRMISRKRERT